MPFLAVACMKNNMRLFALALLRGVIALAFYLAIPVANIPDVIFIMAILIAVKAVLTPFASLRFFKRFANKWLERLNTLRYIGIIPIILGPFLAYALWPWPIA